MKPDNITIGFLPAVLVPKRTQFGKRIRKRYESGEIKMSRHKMTELVPREDGISNTITTVQKDNLLLEYQEKKILCYDCLNHKIHEGDIIGTVVPNFSRFGMTNGWKIIEYEDNHSGIP